MITFEKQNKEMKTTINYIFQNNDSSATTTRGQGATFQHFLWIVHQASSSPFEYHAMLDPHHIHLKDFHLPPIEYLCAGKMTLRMMPFFSPTVNLARVALLLGL
jgi:hypothetical protein